MKWIRISVAAVLLLAFFALIPFYVKSKEELEKAVSCSENAARPLIVFVIDASDPYDSVDADRVVREIKARLSTLSDPTRFVLLGPNETEAYEPRITNDGCVRPELPTSSSYLMSVSDRDLYARERTQTIASAAKGAEQLLRAGPLRTSPLLETVIAVSKRHDVRNASARFLVLYSDMEQNSAALSFYGARSTIPYAAPVELERIALAGARVEVKRIVRRTKLGLQEQERLQSFWSQWFKEAGSTVEWSK